MNVSLNLKKSSILTAALLATSAFFATLDVPTSAFESATSVPRPQKWSATVPECGTRLDDGTLELKGGNNGASWVSESLNFEPGKLYRLRFKTSAAVESGGLNPCGTSFAHYDFASFPAGDVPETPYSFVFFAPKEGAGYLRLGEWDTGRVARFAEPTLIAVQPMFSLVERFADDGKSVDVLELGAGESIRDGVYRFNAFRASTPTNFDRPLVSLNSNFNTSRWNLTAGRDVVYRFALEPATLGFDENAPADASAANRTGKIVKTGAIPFVSGKISLNVGYRTGGRVVLDVSRDGENWTEIGDLAERGIKSFDLAAFLDGKPADALYARARGEKLADGTGGECQLYDLAAELKTDGGDRFSGEGETTFADYVDDANGADGEGKANWTLWGIGENLGVVATDSERFLAVEPEAGNGLVAPVVPGKDVKFGENGTDSALQRNYFADFARPAFLSRRYYPYFVFDFARSISGVESQNAELLSWCEADWRVPMNPKRTEIGEAAAIRLTAPKNDYESFQIVLNGGLRGVSDVRGEVLGDLTNADGASISVENVDLRRAYYHFVENPTDKTCVSAFYPDALIPLEQGEDGKGAPLSVKPGENLPIWTTVKVPTDAAPGKYVGKIRLTGKIGNDVENGAAAEFDATVPFELTVWDFALPVKNTLETAYGASPSTVWRYHNCKTEADKRAVWEKYLKTFGDYRISPYDPAPLDGIGVDWKMDGENSRCELDCSRFAAEMKRVFEKYNFTNFRLPFAGLGGGTYEGKTVGQIAGFNEETPEYKSAMADYGAKLQAALKENGLLDAAYVYWFDEPEPKDYPFVASGFAKLKKYAPEIDRMLTEEPTAGFEKTLDEADADIDVWCPVSPAYSADASKNQRAKGNRFWWYVCCYPKEPFCTEFTDHPAVELRTWHWQAFERDIVGALVWESTYWTSATAFPDSAQDPYEDPMSYVVGYSTPVGTKSFWGNGDGRFIYPPLTAATPGRNNGEPIFDEPNASIRWEEIRAGVQDYELLTILKRLAAEKDATLTSEQRDAIKDALDFSPITTSMTRFSTDPRPLLEKREAVARLIVELSR